MAKKPAAKSDGKTQTKAESIRQYFAAHPESRDSEIVRGLAAQGIFISAANIGSALKRKAKGKAKLNKAPKPIKTSPVAAAATKTGDTSSVAAIFKLVRAVGVDDAESILKALSK